VALVVVGTVAAMVVQAPAVRTDPAYGLLAAMQHEAGRSPNIFTLREADPRDLMRDTTRRVSQWAPAYQAMPHAFQRLGLGWGNALRVTVFLAWACGATGWALYFRTVLGPGSQLAWLVALLLILRPSHEPAYAYSGGEALEWGAFPGVLLVNLWAMTRRSRSSQLPLAALGGALAASLFLLRHGAAIPAAGLGAAWILGALTGRLPRLPALTWSLGAAMVAGGILATGFPGGRTVMGLLYEPPAWAAAWPAATWPLALTDLDGPIRWLFLRLGRPLFDDEAPLLAFGLAALVVLVLVWRVAGPPARPRSEDSLRGAAAWSAPIILGATIVLLAILYARGSAVSFEGRHVRLATLPALPFVFERIVAASGARRPAGQWLGPATLLFFLVVPAVYGVGSLVDKAVIRRARTDALIGPQGIRLDLLGSRVNARALYAELTVKAGDPETVLLLTHPEEAFAVADRRLLVLQAHGLPLEFLGTLTYRGRPSGGVVLVLPRVFDRNGKRQALQAAFRDVHHWQEVPLETTPTWTLWWGR
jgi:hypothetical protein